MCIENVGGKFFGGRHLGEMAGRHLGEMAGSGATLGKKIQEVAPPRGNFGKWRHLGEMAGSDWQIRWQ